MKKGEEYKGFVVQENTFIEEIQVEVIKLKHKKSQAELFHLKNDDSENVFSLAFKTYPENCTGVAHILEHTVLCGSKKFPVRDPFFLMTRRSLNTFMNALTSKIWTAYPAASMNKQDFYNLLDVYIDATLYPLLRKESFFQEASHLAFDEHDQLIYKGVVFNEMKGSLANPYSRLFKETVRALYRNSSYAKDSGGDPKNIVELTHEELIAFHKKYYHPSRCLFYFYGNIDTKEHLDFLDKRIFHSLDTKLDPIPVLDTIAPFTEPKKITTHYPGIKQADQNQDFITFSWVVMDIDEQEDLLALCLLDSILMQTDASPLKKALITSGFCQNVESTLDTDTKQVPYIIIATGCDTKDTDALESLLFKKLKQISQNPIDPHLIEASLTALEVERTEITSGSSPYGLNLFYRCVLPFMQGASHIKPLQVHTLFEKLKRDLKTDNYLQNIIKKYFLDNKHFVTLEMKLSETMQKEEEALEKKNLQKLQETLSQAQIKEIKDMTEALREEQQKDSSYDKNLLPGLSINAIEKKVPYFALDHNVENNFDLFFHDCFCNHFVYLDISMPLANVAFEDLHDLKLFTSFITEVATKEKNYQSQLIDIQNTFSFLSCSIHLNVQKEHLDSLKPSIVMSSGFMMRKAKQACNLKHTIMTSAIFNDTNRLKELILSMHADLQNSMSSQALSLAMKESISPFSAYSNLKNHLSGLSFIEYIDSIASNIDQEVLRLEAKFNDFLHKVFHFHEMDFIVSTEKKCFDELKNASFYDLSHLKKHAFTPFILLPKQTSVTSKANVISLPIAHNALGIQTISSTHNDSQALCLASYIIKNKILHTEIREKGGAYGSGAKYTPLTGMFQFYSYRDPNITRTYKTFEKACHQIVDDGFTQQDLLEAKLSYFSDNESKVSPAARAYITYANEMSDLSKEFRQDFKEKIIQITAKEVNQAIQSHLLPKFSQALFICYTNESMAKIAIEELAKEKKSLSLYTPFRSSKNTSE